jgi:hypothetical protein
MTTSAEQHRWWADALKGNVGPIHADLPQCGRYKMRRGRNGAWQPVAIYADADGVLHAVVGAASANPHEIWTYCAERPIDQETYKQAIKLGRFADDPAPLEQRSNMPADPFAAMAAEIEDRCAQAEQWLAAHANITTQTDSNLARNMQAQILALGKKADADREAEKRPYLEAERAVDAKYKPLTALAKAACEKLRIAFESFMIKEELRLKKEAQEKYERECAAAEAERARIEAERAKKLRDDPVAALTDEPPEMPEPPLAPEPVKVTAGGGVGRKAGLRTTHVPQIEDFQATLLHFADHPDVRDVIDKIVRGLVKTSKGTAQIPGVKIVQERRAA